jgi:uncharacterized protein (TIGR03437 family)
MRLLAAVAALCFTALAQNQFVVVNAAGGRVAPGVAPGSFATLYGTFTGATEATAASVPFPATLGGVSVRVAGIAAPLHFVSTRQINIQVPFGAPAGLQVIDVNTGGSTLSGKIRVVNAAPGIFTQDVATPPKGAILNQDSSLNAESRPARRGEVVQIFGSGPGRFSASVSDGAASPTSPLASTESVPQVFIGGVPAVVQFSGLAPGLVGLWQVNAIIPERPFLSGRVPVVIFVDGVDTNEVTLFVAQ